jgi:hypothetical protein
MNTKKIIIENEMKNKIPKKKIKEFQKKCICFRCLTEEKYICEKECKMDTGKDSLWCVKCKHQEMCTKLNRREQ